MLLLDLQTSGGSFTIVKLTLLKFEITLHVLHLLLSRKLILPCHGALHVLQELGDDLLVLVDVLLVVYLFFFKLFSEFIDLFFFLVKDFVLLFLLTLRLTASSKISVDLLDVSIVSISHAFNIDELLIKSLQLNVVLLNAVLKPIARL